MDESENMGDNEESLEHLQNAMKRMQDEYNIQRAKMKDLFLQKENELARKSEENSKLNTELSALKRELDDVRSQSVVAGMTLENDFEQAKRKANEEIATLQQLVHETIEESSSTRSLYDKELKNLQTYIQQLQNEIVALKQSKSQSPHHSTLESSSLAPSVMLNALTKGFVKKLGASGEAFAAATSNQDGGSEDGGRKVDQSVAVVDHAQEDAEVLRSLIGPLEDQIQALKEKLRSTDYQLQQCKECCAPSETSALSPQGQPCAMCSNYEAQLVNEQQKVLQLEAKVQVAEKAAERHKEDLLKEIGFRKDMEEKWAEKREEHKNQVAEFTRGAECAEQDLKELQQFAEQSFAELGGVLKRLTLDREKIQKELLDLQKENDFLVGRYTVHSQELESEAINLPSTVDELHELVLRHHQDIIIAKVGKEAALEKVNSLQSDIMLLRDEMGSDQHKWESLENDLVQEMSQIRQQKEHLEKEKKMYLANQEKLEASERLHTSKIAELEKQISDLATLKTQTLELRNRVSSLQHELDNSEAVQKDFVRLSQNLQVQLEKIRESDTQVRWQHDEDASQCPTCHYAFAQGTKKKEHCRHCGQIFCHGCLVKSVESGASQLPSKVCDVCHTLLVKSSAPYFSEAPPPLN